MLRCVPDPVALSPDRVFLLSEWLHRQFLFHLVARRGRGVTQMNRGDKQTFHPFASFPLMHPAERAAPDSDTGRR